MATFKAKARALDMLGRQQIAGIPTAISELFKNAHDAYADHVEVDLYRSSSLLIIRDDGLGMTRDDFEARWLTLGTESKLNAGGGLLPPPKDLTKPSRPILGEKGIGRLAIATLGPQVLILTRSKQFEHNSELVVAFIHWGLFEAPGIDLDQIEIPVRTFPGGSLPSRTEIDGIVDELRNHAHRLNDLLPPQLANKIHSDLDRFGLDLAWLEARIQGPSLTGTNHGTQFYILPADEAVVANIEADTDDRASPLTKLLIGFTNTMTPGRTPPQIQTAFRDHVTDASSTDLIAEREFFTPEEFLQADHRVSGEFDEFGQFTGSVTVYGEETPNYTLPWSDARGRRTSCGPFRISFAYIQGERRATSLTPQQHARMLRKLNRIGGLYIYKDGIRILPYGDNSFDFLDVERRRTQSASYYFFSYRRMFGAIEITQQQNSALTEKAGREGFRENRAYREFRSILSNLLLQLAADFFREEGVRADTFIRRREELGKLDEARRRREKLTTARRRSFREQLQTGLLRLDSQEPQRQADALLSGVRMELDATAVHDDPVELVPKLIRVELDARRQLDQIRASYRLTKPAGVGLPRELRRDWDFYSAELDQIEAEVFDRTAKSIDALVSDAAGRAHVAVAVRLRLEAALSEQSDNALRSTRQVAKDAREAVQVAAERVVTIARESIAAVDSTVRDVEKELARTDVSKLTEEESTQLKTHLLGRIESVAGRKRELLKAIQEQIGLLSWDTDADGRLVTTGDALEAMDEELLELRERADLDIELTQLGLAIQVINHEFDASIRTIRRNLENLRGWASMNPGLRQLYDDIRMSFDHLDGYLNLFTPLSRRSDQSPVEIRGSDIGQFLDDLFSDRLGRHSVSLRKTRRFATKRIHGYPSTIYPVFVNLIDNAIFWLRDCHGDRWILLDADDRSFIVADSGPGIPARDRDVVFELGFSRKPGGRGMGLYISRDVLQRSGFDLQIEDSDRGATFRITERAKGEEIP